MTTLQRLKPSLLWLAIFNIPFQLGLHFWPSWSYVAGFKIDYLSPTLYLTDIFIFLYIISNLQDTIKKTREILTTNYLKTILFLFFIILNIIFSLRASLTIYLWIKVLFLSLFFVSLTTEKDLIKKIQTPLLVSVAVVVSLEILQFFKQSSLNGIFYFLGERNINLNNFNTAKINLCNNSLINNYNQCHLLLRPYSTFSHPNSLSGYLLIIFVLSTTLFNSTTSFLKKIIFSGILLTFSKAAIISLTAITIYKKIKPSLIKQIFLKTTTYTSILISIIPLFVKSGSLPFSSSSSILSRLYLGPPTLQIIIKNFLTGVGLGNFIPSLSANISPSHIFANTLQPVHSVLLLAVSEIGLIGVILIIIFFITNTIFKNKLKHLQNTQSFFAESLIILTITSSVDHYWWTLHQNNLILILILAIIISNNNSKKNDLHTTHH